MLPAIAVSADAEIVFLLKIQNMESEIFYFLSTGDIQTVAKEELGRELNKAEVERLKVIIPEKIDWYGAISDCILNEQIH